MQQRLLQDLLEATGREAQLRQGQTEAQLVVVQDEVCVFIWVCCFLS